MCPQNWTYDFVQSLRMARALDCLAQRRAGVATVSTVRDTVSADPPDRATTGAGPVRSGRRIHLFADPGGVHPDRVARRPGRWSARYCDDRIADRPAGGGCGTAVARGGRRWVWSSRWGPTGPWGAVAPHCAAIAGSPKWSRTIICSTPTLPIPSRCCGVAAGAGRCRRCGITPRMPDKAIRKRSPPIPR